MEIILANVSAGPHRRVTLNQRDTFACNASLIVEGVLNGSKGSLYYPLSEMARNPEAWNHVPLTVNHPLTANGQPASARDPEVLRRQGIGHVDETRVEGNKLLTTAYFDVADTQRIDNRVYDALISGKAIELSTGLHTEQEEAPDGATFNGRPYTHIARAYRPDHVAALPDQVGACILPGQEIQGRIVKASKAWYAGEAIKIRTLSGEVLSVTPNHPVLTSEGFVPAGRLTEGQHLLHYVGEDESFATDDNEENAPALAEDVFETLQRFDGVKKRVRTSSLDFHGDAAFFQSDVEVVRAQRSLRGDCVPQTAKGLAQSGFRRRSDCQTPLSGGGYTEQRVDCVNSADIGPVGSSRQPFAVGGASPGKSQPRSVGASTGNSLLGQTEVNRSDVDSCCQTDLSDRFASEVVSDYAVNKTVRKPLAGNTALAEFRIFGPGAELDLSLHHLVADRMGVCTGRDDNVSDGFSGKVGSHPLINHVFGNAFSGRNTAVGLANDDATLGQPLADCRTAEAELFRELIQSFPGKVIADKIIRVDRFFHSGPVYDFESTTGYILAEKLIVSNCSVKDGCGVLINADTRTVVQKFFDWWTGTTQNAKGDGFESDEQRKAFFGLKASGELGGGKGGGKDSKSPSVHPDAKEHLTRIMSRPHPPKNASQAEEQGKNEYFNNSSLAKAFKSPREAGAAIRAAYEAEHGKTTHNVDETTANENEESAMNRDAIINHLTTNCACWKAEGDREVLNAFSDEKLTALKTADDRARVAETTTNQLLTLAKEAGAPADLTVNAMPTFLKEKLAQPLTDEDEKKAKDMQTNATTPPPAPPKPMTLNEWLATTQAPPPIRDAVRNAVAITQREQQALVAQLIANVAEGDAKTALAAYLSDKSLDELRLMTPLAPAPSRQQHAPVGYYGAAVPQYPALNRQVEEDRTDDVLIAPTLNFAEEAQARSA